MKNDGQQQSPLSRDFTSFLFNNPIFLRHWKETKTKKNPDICSKKEKYCLATRSCVCVDIVRLPSTLPHSATAVADPARRAVKTETGESQVVEERSFRIYKIPQRNLRSCRRRRRTQKPKQQQNETMATFCVTGFTLSKVVDSAKIKRIPCNKSSPVISRFIKYTSAALTASVSKLGQ